MNLKREVEKLLPEAKIYPSSVAEVSDGQALMLRLHGKDLLAVSGSVRERYQGEERGNFRLCPLTHENRLALNRAFPYTAPRAF